MPKKVLSVGMGGMLFAQIGEQIFGLLAGDLQPEGIGAKIELTRPSQDAALLTNGCTAEVSVVFPRCEDTLACLGRKIHFACDAVIEAQPNTIAVQYIHGRNLYHRVNNSTARAAAAGNWACLIFGGTALRINLWIAI
jgi:hypothetical protein